MKYWLLLSYLVISLSIKAQSFDFKIYDTTEGLPQNYVYAIEQDNHGFIWMATGEGLIRYDGVDYVLYTTKDSLSHNFIRCTHIDANGRLWLGHKNGFITYHEDGIFHKIKVDNANKDIFDISEDSEGNIWAVDQRNGLIRISNKDKSIRTFFDRKKFGRKKYTAIDAISPTKMLVGTTAGLFVFEFDESLNNVDITQISDIPDVWIESINKRKRADNEFWVGTKDKGFFFYSYDTKNSEHITDNDLCRRFSLDNEVVTDIYEEREGHLLIGTQGSGVIKLIYDPVMDDFHDSFKYSTINGLNKDDIEDIFCDREGNYWIGTNGGGVALLVNQYFVFYNLDNEKLGFRNYEAHSVYKDGDNLWIGLDKGLLLTKPMYFSDAEFFNQEYGGIPNDKVKDFYKSDDGILWVATENKGLYFKSKTSSTFKKYNYSKSLLGQKINGVTGNKNFIYVASQNGLYIINRNSRKIELVDMGDGLPHNNINFVYLDKHNNVWVGPKENGLCKVIAGDKKGGLKVERHKLIRGAIDISDMTEDINGNKWLATKGKGILYYSKDTLKSINDADGLKKNFCSSISCDDRNDLWVCHQGGLSCIDVKTGDTKVYGHKDELGSEFFHVAKDDDGTMWFASNDGVVNYLPEKDRINDVAPILNLTGITINGEPVEATKSLKLPFPYEDNYYNLRINFRAISFDRPEKVTYKFRIDELGEENADKTWTSLGTTDYKEIDYLRHGKYKIRILAYNADGVATSLPLTININIAKPFWLSLWFVASSILLLLLVLYMVIKYRERALIRQKEILQREVDSQTVVLREQKAEIERKNRDITDSINYAKKIQSSILPSTSNLMDEFPGSFVYFKPRDIVSGDFYWFYQSKDYFVVCCADCTGHGVPGAFMSMIGTTILNDIAKLPEIDSPSGVLERLDHEIKKLLHSNNESEAKDGMDISVVEIHKLSRQVRIASAKRPVYLVIDNELTLYKGTRRSVGDHHESGGSIPFMNVEYSCKKGDQIYMFSDGYPDQFGGPLGKKFMKVGVQQLIEEVHDKPSEQQFDMVRSNFEDWQGDLDQIDDVLFMGVRL